MPGSSMKFKHWLNSIIPSLVNDGRLVEYSNLEKCAKERPKKVFKLDKWCRFVNFGVDLLTLCHSGKVERFLEKLRDSLLTLQIGVPRSFLKNIK